MKNAPREPAAQPPTSTEGSAERLVDLQLAFNLYPSWYAHSTWLAQLGIADSETELQNSPLWTRAVSSALLRSEQLEQHFDNDFFDPAKRLALLDAATLTRVAGLASATLLREKLKRAVRQDEVRALQACIGAEAHAFAVRWGGLLPMVNPPFAGAGWPTRAEWERASIIQLFAALPAHAIGVMGRLRMRFPNDWGLPRQRLAEPQRVGLTRLIVAVILQSSPLWRWLFEAAPTAEA
jgi:hypothetical protein